MPSRKLPTQKDKMTQIRLYFTEKKDKMARFSNLIIERVGIFR